jgi:hypothetical protein
MRPETPHLKLELALGSKLTEDSGCHVLATIHRAGDSHEEPCIFRWGRHDATAAFLLFHHTPDGLRKIEIASEPPSAALQAPVVVDGWGISVRELAPGGRVRSMITLPKRYRTELVSGEKYELVWPGGEIAIWDWGTEKQHIGREVGMKSPKICLPAARATLEFNKFGQATEGRGSPPPISASERMQVLLSIE